MTFGVHTLNGRFIWLISFSVLAISSLTLYSHLAVQSSSSQSLEYVQANRDLIAATNAVKNSLQKTESALYQYTTFLSNEHRGKIFEYLAELNNRASELKRLPAISITEIINTKSSQLSVDIVKLKAIIEQYIHIMQDVESRYPGMPILLTHLSPTNRKFSEAVELAISESEYTDFQPKVIKKDSHRVMQLFQEARYAWSMQISWLRIFVANRMGAFGDPEKAMRNNLHNRNLFALTVKSMLDELDSYNKRGLLGLQQEESLHQMREALIYYNIYFDKAVALYMAKDWRADASLLRGALQPALDNTWDTANAIERAIAEINNIGVSESQNTANMLSSFTWVFAGITSLLLFLAFTVFQKKIRQPVLMLANSMAHEDPLQNNIPDSQGHVEEIGRLIDAYTAMRQQVYSRQSRLESILDTAAEGIITIDDSGKIESINAAAQRLFDYDATEILGKAVSIITNHELENDFITGNILKNKTRQELMGTRRDGSTFYMSLKVSQIGVGNRRLFTAIVDDISERRAVMEHLRHLAEHDSLTGLHNRQYFNDALERAFEQANRSNKNNCACLYIDLDNFKYINDTLGHLEGDRLLIGIASTLKNRTRKSDILARLGGDEFALLLQNITREQVVIVADEYREAIAGFSFIADGKRIDAGCSIGVTMYETDIENKEGMLTRADIACHMAKRAGRNRVHVFENADKDKIDSLYEEMGWSRRIRDALENDSFVFSCQPIISVSTGEIYSHELLLRMIDPDTQEYILPGGFLDSAERFGLMPAVDKWVITHAFQWLNEQPDDGRLSYFINLSGKSIGDDKLLEHIRSLLPVLTIHPGRIVFEITEDVAIAELEKAQHFLKELRSMGFKTALDDFGVGYSSFSYLREFDVDFIKIDGSFINSMHTDALNFALVSAHP